MLKVRLEEMEGCYEDVWGVSPSLWFPMTASVIPTGHRQTEEQTEQKKSAEPSDTAGSTSK